MKDDDKRLAKQMALQERFGGLPIPEILLALIDALDTLEQVAVIAGVTTNTLRTWLSRHGLELQVGSLSVVKQSTQELQKPSPATVVAVARILEVGDGN